ncbi:MAG TPA: alpha/beta hydrolase [Terracidiphilus sp.]|nr:alpha/beta hydrolase [Terracidiphilus sp.]
MPRPSTPRKPSRAAPLSSSAQPPTVSPVWLFSMLGGLLFCALVLAWSALCLVFWQGSWQLLYHPTAKLTRTPAAVGLSFSPVGLATTETGLPRLSGWWIPAASNAPFANTTALYLHGATGNLSDTVSDLQRLHAAGLTILAIDYRGYGQSQFVHPSEARFLQDANWSLEYLTDTRHVAPGSILLVGQGLGSNLAIEAATAHPNLAGVVLENPVRDPASAIFSDDRAKIVPAHWLVRDRWDLNAAAAHLQTPALWLQKTFPPGQLGLPEQPAEFQRIPGPKSFVWMISSADSDADFARILDAWLRDLPNHARDFPPCQLNNDGHC